jgi:hypothetical protein
VATDGVAEDHATELVRFCVLPSLKVPVAVNCCVAFFVTVGFPGVTERDFNVALITVKEVEPLTAPDEAVMLVLPAALAVASPPALMFATPRFCELHAALAVMS